MGRSHPISDTIENGAGRVADASSISVVPAGQYATDVRYSLPAIILHWLMAFLLIGQLAVGLYMVELPKRTPEVAYYYNLHKSFGLVALMLIVLRISWRWMTPAPAQTGLHRSALQARVAQLSHRLLYACMLLIPAFGLAGSSFGKYPVKFFGYALPRLGMEDPMLQTFFRQAHAVMAWLLCALIVLHLIAVIYHLSTSGKMIVRRMTPRL